MIILYFYTVSHIIYKTGMILLHIFFIFISLEYRQEIEWTKQVFCKHQKVENCWPRDPTQLVSVWLLLLITCYIECWRYANFGSHHTLKIKSSTLETDTTSFYWAHLSRFHLKMETESSLQNFVFLNKRWIMFRIIIVILIYRCHKPIDSINLLGS
jgi:hypothetical protein